MTGPKPQACIVGDCASGFPYKDECGLISNGCAARRMLEAASRTEGACFPMDLSPGGNPFVNALEARGLVRVGHDITFAIEGAA